MFGTGAAIGTTAFPITSSGVTIVGPVAAVGTNPFATSSNSSAFDNNLVGSSAFDASLMGGSAFSSSASAAGSLF